MVVFRSESLFQDTSDIASAGEVLRSSVQDALDTQLTKAVANYKKVDCAAQRARLT